MQFDKITNLFGYFQTSYICEVGIFLYDFSDFKTIWKNKETHVMYSSTILIVSSKNKSQ